MSNIVEFTASSDNSRGETRCWLCQRPLDLRALFCHNCGTIQPVRDIDHFARLGLERRIDLDPDLLDKQYAAMRRTLAPERFALRGMGERGHAAKQLEALEVAYETLREPLRRGRYWLVLHQQENYAIDDANTLVVELGNDLQQATVASQCDRVAQRAGQAIEQGIKKLMQALRSENWRQANYLLAELDGLEGILNNIHDRRDQLAVPTATSDDCTRLR